MQSDDQTFLGGDVTWGPQEYMHIEGCGKRYARDVSEAIKMDYRTYEQRWARDTASWEAWPQAAVYISNIATGRGHEARLEISVGVPDGILVDGSGRDTMNDGLRNTLRRRD